PVQMAQACVGLALAVYAVDESFDIMGYLKYVQLLFRYISVYELQAILRFDSHFRKNKVKENRLWTDANSYIERLYLTSSRGVQSEGKGLSTGRARDKCSQASVSKRYCISFNSGKACTVANCQYGHKCAKCDEATHGYVACKK